MFCSDLRASLNGKGVPEDIKARLLAMHEENLNVKEQLKTAQEKLVKARAVRLKSYKTYI
jgi:protein HOOK3